MRVIRPTAQGVYPVDVVPASTGAVAAPRVLPQIQSIAFFSHHQDAEAGGEHVQLLLWPTTPDAWTSLTQAWRVLRSTEVRKPTTTGAAWVRTYAPQLCAVFGESPALETSVAALLTRAAVGASLAVGLPGRSYTQRQLLLECLQGYQEFLATPGRSSWLAAISDPPIDASTAAEDFRAASQGIPFARTPQWHLWEGGTEPIPLELARVAAAAVSRYCADRGAPNPIYDALQRKLVRVPPSMLVGLRGRRR